VNACWKIFQEIYITYLGKKEIYCNFKMYCIISVSFATKFHLFLTFISFCSYNMFFTNHALIFKYQPGRIKVKIDVKPTWTLNMLLLPYILLLITKEMLELDM